MPVLVLFIDHANTDSHPYIFIRVSIVTSILHQYWEGMHFQKDGLGLLLLCCLILTTMVSVIWLLEHLWRTTVRAASIYSTAKEEEQSVLLTHRWARWKKQIKKCMPSCLPLYFIEKLYCFQFDSLKYFHLHRELLARKSGKDWSSSAYQSVSHHLTLVGIICTT